MQDVLSVPIGDKDSRTAQFDVWKTIFHQTQPNRVCVCILEQIAHVTHYDLV
jgi:hypothetical protein